MIPLTPAPANTYVVELDESGDSIVRTPILAWVIVDKRPVPVTIHGVNVLVGGTAVEYPCGRVNGPLDAETFESAESWAESSPNEPRQPPAATRAPAAGKKPAAPTEADDTSPYDIVWTTKTFKSNSFWHYDDGEYEFVFIVEPDNGIPKASDKLVKVKRDELMKLKKEVDLLEVADVINADPLPVADEDEDDDGDMI